MKRKGRKPKTAENIENGENDKPETNGEPLDDEPHKKKRRGSSKRTNASFSARNAANNAPSEDSDAHSADEDEEPEEKKKKRDSKRRSGPFSAKNSSTNATSEESDAKSAEEDAQYEVESVLDEKNIRGVRHYLIRWKGYEPESDTWEPESTLNCAELIAEFRAKKKKKGGGAGAASKLSGPRASSSKRGKTGSKDEATWDENENFEVDRILEVHFKKNGSREFLVSWKGYPQSQSSWEPEENMNCPELIEKFMAKVERAKESDQRELRVKRPHTDRFTLLMGGSGRRISKRNQGKQRIHYHDAE